ncbi:MAG: hypothetical protein AB8B59_01380 [Maribacter sp.]
MKQVTVKASVFISLILLIAISCNTKEQTIEKKPKPLYTKGNYDPTILPNDTTNLWMSEGAIESDTVLILGDGGPKNQLDYEFDGKIGMSYLPNFKSYYIVNLHQASTYNKEIFNWQNEFTLEMAKKEVDNSSEIMSRAINYFKDRDKYIIVVGHSYSAFIIPNYISTRSSFADKYIITGGRLRADSLQTVYQLKNINTIFQEDGLAINKPDENRSQNPNRTRRYFKLRQAKNYLKAAIGQIDYTKTLENKDISNWTFIYGKKDRNVGVPTKYELDFLKSKKVQILGVDSDHYNIWKHVIDSVKAKTIKL